MTRSFSMTSLLVVALCVSVTLLSQAAERNVTIVLTTAEGGKEVNLELREALYKSPFGGWVVATWPFNLKVDDKVIFQYRSLVERQDADRMITDEHRAIDDFVDEISEGKKKDEVKGDGKDKGKKVEEKKKPDNSALTPVLSRLNLKRKASAELILVPGSYAIQPLGISFTIAEDGAISTNDPRLRVDTQTGRLAVICHPVTIRLAEGVRSHFGLVTFSCANANLLGDLDKQLEEYDQQATYLPKKEPTGRATRMRSMTLYLPASVEKSPYDVNGVKFHVNAEGQVKLAEGAKARCADGRVIWVLLPDAAKAAPAPATQAIGVTCFGAKDEVRIDKDRIFTSGGVGSGAVWVPATGSRSVNLNDLKIDLPTSDARWPHTHLVWNVAKRACWMIDTAPLAAKPGAP